MITLADIRGQPRVVALLRRALAAGRVPHAYLFAGPAGSGKHTTGLALAAALNCDEQPGEGCGRCASCERIAAAIHPDVQTLAREGAAQIIPIETIRTQLLPQLGLPPHEGRARVFLVEEAAALQGPAANALLKTLEEPPSRTHFVLATTAPDQLLPTIRSRCQRVAFAARPPDATVAVDEEEAAALEKRQARVEQLERALASARPRDLAAAAGDTGDRLELAAALRLWATRLYRSARAAAIAGQLPHAVGQARRASAVLETEQVLTMHNAHGQLAVDDLLRRLLAVPCPPASGGAA